MRLYASVTIHDASERQKFLSTLKTEFRVAPVCHNDTIEIRYMGLAPETRKLAGICLEFRIHSVHLSA